MKLVTKKQSIFETGKNIKSKHQEILIHFHFELFLPNFSKKSYIR